MSKYRYLLWDIDGTVLDFLAAERAAVRSLFRKYGFGECTEEMLQRYSAINVKYWEALERGEMTKPQILVGRFREFFETVGIDSEKAPAFNDDYQLALGDTIVFCDDSLSLLREEKGRYVLIAVTNGTGTAQLKKLSLSGLDRIFDHICISEQLGAEKPSPVFFDRVFEIAGITDRSQALIIGDSLTSDIRGGVLAGIDTCWYDPFRKPLPASVPVPTYTITNLNEIRDILGR